MTKGKWRILCLLGFSFVSVCQANNDIDTLYNRIAQKDVQALNKLKTLAKDNNAQALAELGFIYEYGVAVPIDIAQAIKYYEQACNLGGDFGCYNARYFYQYGQGVAQDESRAQVLADKMNKNGLENVEAETIQLMVKNIYDTKVEAAKDPAQRSQFIAEVYRPIGMGSEWRALISRLGFTTSDILHLAELWADGDPEITYQVAHLYDFGFGEVENKETVSATWFRKAAELGQSDAQNILGSFYSHGERGFTLDSREGMKWYELAAKQGNVDAFVNLGEIYYSGKQVPLDYTRAFELFERAVAKEDDPRAWTYLAWMYTNGQSVKTDCEKAMGDFTKGQSRNIVGDKAHFLATCEKDRQARADAVAKRDYDVPKLTFNRDRIFGASQGSGYACELEFVVKTDRISSIENLRVSLALKNKAGAISQQVIAFEPFGLNTQNRNLQGYESDTLRESTLQPIYQPEFCEVDSYSVTAVTGIVNGKEMDILKAGIFL